MTTAPRLTPFARVVIAGLVGVLVTSCSRGSAQSGAEQKAPVVPDAQTAATRALDPLKKLVTAENARDMGF